MNNTPDININQLGYYQNDKKIAVLRGKNLSNQFKVINSETGEVVYTSTLSDEKYNSSSAEYIRLADFTGLTSKGKYYIENDEAGKSYTFEIGDGVYDAAFKKIIKMFYLQRCGTRLSLKHAGKFRHPACHTELATVYETGELLDVSGGWHDAGDYGRYTVAAAKSVTDLMLAYKRNPDKFNISIGIPESKNDTPDILDEIRYELEWMMKMQREDGGVYHKITGKFFPDAVMPHKEKDMLVTPVSTTATADFAASMAIAYTVYSNFDAEFANECLRRAILSQDFLDEHKDFIYTNIDEITTGEYGDYSDTDERYFASAALFNATGEEKYITAIENFINEDFSQELGWQSVGGYGSYLILTSENRNKLLPDTYSEILNKFQAEARRLVDLSANEAYSTALDDNGYVWGSNMNVANNAMLLLMMNDIEPSEKYTSPAKAQLDYILGTNPMGISYVTGTGSGSPMHPHHRPSINKSSAMPGMLVGGPDAYLDDDCAKQELNGMAPAKCYIDNDSSYSTNEITIYWNSPLVFLMSEFL